MTLSGPPSAIAELSKEKLELWIGGKEVKNFSLDVMCPSVEGAGGTVRPGAPGSGEPLAVAFFFDLVQMSTAGRQRSVEVARELVRRLAGNGMWGMVLANANEFLVVQDLTSSSDLLLAALDRVEGLEVGLPPLPDEEGKREEALRRRATEQLNERQFMSGQILGKKEKRPPGNLIRLDPLAQMVGLMTVGAIASLANEATVYQREETRRAEMSFQRLGWSLARFSGVSGRKILLYFGDTLRTAAGEHYFRTLREVAPEFAASSETLLPVWSGKHGQPFGLEALFDFAVNAAAWRGIRFYTVEAQGLAGGSSRVRDAQNTLSALALETGGRAFLNGVEAPAIADGLLEDFRCFGLLSLSPEGFPQDRSLTVRVAVRDKRIRVRARGRVVIPSEKTLAAEAVLSAALAVGEPGGEPSPGLVASVIPLGVEAGRLNALAQVAAVGPGRQGSWHLGGTVVSGSESPRAFWGRVGGPGPDAVAAIEEQVTLTPGFYELVAVGRDSGSEEALSRWVGGHWVPAEGDRVSITPVVVLQAATGVFVRAGGRRTAGSLGIPDGVKLKSGVPTALVSLVCAGPERKAVVRVLRRLVGEEATEFEARVLDEGGERGRDRCVQVRDTVPGGVLGAGYYRYEIEAVGEEGEILARAERVFEVEEAGSGEEQPEGH